LGPIPEDVQWNQNNQVIFKISLLIDHNRDNRTLHAIQAALKTKQLTAAIDSIDSLEIQFVIGDNEGQPEQTLTLAREHINNGSYAIITGKFHTRTETNVDQQKIE
jgi:hypothetical protein